MSELTLSASEIAAAITKGLEGYTPSVEARTVVASRRSATASRA